jgi:predicted SprT family Zn-dependent metalloprotease
MDKVLKPRSFMCAHLIPFIRSAYKIGVPWRCPACRLAIQHSDAEPQPRRGVIYRCHVCRLELILDESTGKMTVAPLPTTRDDSDEG